MVKNLLGKVNSSANKFLAALMFLVVFGVGAFAQETATTLSIPSSAETTLVATINNNFGVVIGVIIAFTAACVLIKLIRKVG
jgi:hypothetical protein